MSSSGAPQLAREHGDKPAVIMAGSGATLSYGELERQPNKIAHLFRSRGLRPGDHIAVLMENRPEFFPVVWAAQRSGLFYTPVNRHLSAAEAAYIVADCGARLLVSSSDLEGYYVLYPSGTTGQPNGILPALTGQPFGTTSAPMTATSCRPARSAPSGSAGRGGSATTMTRRRPSARFRSRMSCRGCRRARCCGGCSWTATARYRRPRCPGRSNP